MIRSNHEFIVICTGAYSTSNAYLTRASDYNVQAKTKSARPRATVPNKVQRRKTMLETDTLQTNNKTAFLWRRDYIKTIQDRCLETLWAPTGKPRKVPYSTTETSLWSKRAGQKL